MIVEAARKYRVKGIPHAEARQFEEQRDAVAAGIRLALTGKK